MTRGGQMDRHHHGRPATSLFERFICYAGGLLNGLVSSLRMTPDQRRRRDRQRWREHWEGWVNDLIESSHQIDPAVLHQLPTDPLRHALLGRTRAQVAALLGPPAATSPQRQPASTLGYWQADIWYYPMDVRRRLGLAVHFQEDTVEELERVEGPE